MTEDLIELPIPASFVGARLTLLPEELSFGYFAGWLDEAAVIKMAEQELALGLKLPSAVEQAALLLSDERTQVPGLLDQIDVEDDARAAEVWIYLSLAWLYEHLREYQDPFGVIEMVYADFDYPEDIEEQCHAWRECSDGSVEVSGVVAGCFGEVVPVGGAQDRDNDVA